MAVFSDDEYIHILQCGNGLKNDTTEASHQLEKSL